MCTLPTTGIIISKRKGWLNRYWSSFDVSITLYLNKIEYFFLYCIYNVYRSKYIATISHTVIVWHTGVCQLDYILNILVVSYVESGYLL